LRLGENSSEKKSAENQQTRPNQRTQETPLDERKIVHSGRTGGNWHEGSHYWHETGKNNSLPTVAGEKVTGTV